MMSMETHLFLNRKMFVLKTSKVQMIFGTIIVSTLVYIICSVAVIYAFFYQTPKQLLHETHEKPAPILVRERYKFLNDLHYDQMADLRIIAIVSNRSKSLSRLLRSLNDAVYFNDSVELNVWIDRGVNEELDEDTYEIATTFQFMHGRKQILAHPSHVGIYGQWTMTLDLSIVSSEIIVVLEDDIEVSPFFYKWLKLVHRKYDSYSNINGYSLHGMCDNHGFTALVNKYINPSQNSTVFLYPALNTWGFSPNVRNWIHFVKWMHLKLNDKTFEPFIPNFIPSVWYKKYLRNGTEKNMWSIWHVYHSYINGLFTMFPNLPGNRGLAIHWREKGLHYGENSDKQPSGKLLLEWSPQMESLPSRPGYFDLAGIKLDTRGG